MSTLIELNYGEHITVLGMTGSGKTVCEQWLFAQFPRAIMYDVEDYDGWEYCSPKTVIVSNVDQLKALVDIINRCNLPEIHVVYKAHEIPMGEGLTADFDMFCDMIFRNLTGFAVFADELGMINQLRPMDSQAPQHYSNIMLRGRKRKLTMCGAAQRNQHIPKLQITQSVHHIIYQMDGVDMMVYRKSGLLSGGDSDTLGKLAKYHAIYRHGNSFQVMAPVPVVRDPVKNIPLKY